MNGSPRSYDFLWLSIALFPLLIIAMLLPIQPHDYWWYLRLGRETLAAGHVPVVDTFSWTQAGQPIVYQSWLSAVILWVVWQVGEVPLTFLLIALMIGATYTTLWLLVRSCGAGSRLATLILLLAGLAGSNNWSLRPQLLVYPLFLWTVWVLLKWQRGEDRNTWLLIPLGIVWVNLHGSFILLFILVGLALIPGAGRRRSLLGPALLALGGTLINPRGLALWHSVIATFVSPGIRDLSPEWLPPINQGWQMNIFFAWLILLPLLAGLTRRRPSGFEWMLFLSFSWLALTGMRYVIWDVFILSMLTARLMPESILSRFDQPQVARTPGVNFGLGFALLLIPVMLLPGLREHWWREAPAAVDRHTPTAAASWLAEHPELPGPMWNDVVFGSYLIYALPSRPVGIDTRIQVIYTPVQADQYLHIQSAKPGWEASLQQQGVNLLMLARTQPDLVEAVVDSDEWCMRYQDDVSLILARCEPLP